MRTSTRFMIKPVVVALAVSLGAASLSPSVDAADQSYTEQQVRVAQNALAQDKPDVKVAKGAVQRAFDSLVVVVDTVVETAAK